jgi:hypothetical protein
LRLAVFTAQALLASALSGCSDDGAVFARDRSGRAQRWQVEAIEVRVVAPHASTGLDFEKLERAAKQAARAWSVKGLPRIEIRKAERALGEAEDGVNALLVRHDRWCPSLGGGGCYDPARSGFTLLRSRPSAEKGVAEIMEGDVLLNSVGYRFDAEGELGSLARLEAVLVHEFGHLLGLDHPCGPRAKRGSCNIKGTPVEPCVDAGKFRDAVMFPDVLGRPLVSQPSKGELEGLKKLYSETSTQFCYAASGVATALP